MTQIRGQRVTVLLVEQDVHAAERGNVIETGEIVREGTLPERARRRMNAFGGSDARSEFRHRRGGRFNEESTSAFSQVGTFVLTVTLSTARKRQVLE
jgi:hypothetical protein